MKTTGGSRPALRYDTTDASVVGMAGGRLLVETLQLSGLSAGLSAALARWRKPYARHDPGKIVADLAVALGLGGDCLADVGVLRAEPDVFGPVASDATVSRLIAALATDADQALKQIWAAHAAARARVWQLAGDRAPGHARSVTDPLVIDVDATLVTAHSDKEQAAPTFKRGFGFHPLCAFVDHGADGTGEAVGLQLRPGNAGSNTAADHITVLRQAFAQIPGIDAARPGKTVLVRVDGAGATHHLLDWLQLRRVQYSVGYTLPAETVPIIEALPDSVWQPALTSDGQIKDGAFVAELTGMLDLTGWPAGMRIIIRKERPHPGAQLRLTDADGHRITAFATNTRTGQLQQLELRHRRRARCEDRIRLAKDTGLHALPLHGFDQNKIWCALVTLAVDLIAWTQLLAFTDHEARRWEPRRLRYRLFTIPARLVHSQRQHRLHYPTRHPWTRLLTSGLAALVALRT